eukprot:jgi/Ulvmu1/9368/UM050_0120.1
MAAPALVGLGTLVLARTGLRLRTRATQQHEDVGAIAEQRESTTLVNGACESATGMCNESVGEPAAAAAESRDAQSSNLNQGATICLVGPAGELMGLKSTTSGKPEELSLVPISTSTIEAGASRKIQSYPSHSIFVVNKQGEDLCLASPYAAGMLLEMCKDSNTPMKVSSRKPTKSNTWRFVNGDLINNATTEKLNLTPQLLHAFSVEEMRERDRAVNNRERQLQAEVNCLRDRLRKDGAEHKELVAQVSEERVQSEKDISELDAQLQDYRKMLKDTDDDCRRKGALLKQLEARLADIAMGSSAAGDGSGAMSDIVRHWQEQVAAAEERAAAAHAANADQTAAMRDEHAQAMGALRQEHAAALEALEAHIAAADERAMAAAEEKQLTRLAEAEPAIAALQARTLRQADKIRQQNDVIRELATEVERLSDAERELLDEVQRLSYADHALINISRSIVEATTPRDPMPVSVPRNPWQDRETQHERLVRETSLASSLSGRSRPHTADNSGWDGRSVSGGRGRRLSAGDPSSWRESVKARRLSATSEAGQGIAVANEAMARSTAQWPSPPRPHMPTSLVPQTSVPEDEPLCVESSGRLESAQSVGSGIDFATAFAEVGAAGTSGRADDPALADATNSPRGARNERSRDWRAQGPASSGADENAPEGGQQQCETEQLAPGGHSTQRVGMGQADIEFSKAAREEMSVLQHNTRTLSRRRTNAPTSSSATAAPPPVHEEPGYAHSDAGSATVQSQPQPSKMRRSVSLGNKPRPAALDLTCIPDLMPDAEDLAGAPSGVAEGTEPDHQDGSNAAVESHPEGLAEIAVKPQAVVRTPVAQRVMRMNKISAAQDLQRQPSGSDLSRATSGSSMAGRAHGLQHTVSSVAAPGRPGHSSGCVAAYRAPGREVQRSVSGTSGLPRELEPSRRAAESRADLRQSVDSKGLKAHAAITAATGDSGKSWANRPPTAPNPVGYRHVGGRGLLHPQRASTIDSAASSSRLPRPPQQAAPVQESVMDESCSVQRIADKFSTPEKLRESRRGDSPRWGRRRSMGSRSRHAHRALGVFPSRSFSAGAAGSALSDALRNCEATADGRRSSRGDEAPGVAMDEEDTCGRRLSMGDPRVHGTRPGVPGAKAECWSEKPVEVDAQPKEAGSRPMFLQRNTIQSIDVKPW